MQIIISREYMQTKKLFLATPCYGGICNGIFAKCVADLQNICMQLGINLQLYMLFNESLITRARNYSIDEFMRSDATHFIFIDSDIGFDPMYIVQMMALQTPDSNYDIIGAAYPKKCISWEKIMAAVNKGFAEPSAEFPNRTPEDLGRFVGDYVFNPKNGTQGIPIGEPCEVLEIGTGFMMVKRSAFETFRDAHPEYLYRPDHVRTEHFDGSRQITMYFQAAIDEIDFRKVYETEVMRLIESGGATAEDLAGLLNKAQELNSKKSNRYLSEDYWFCQKMQELNLKTWLCPWMALTHTGSMVYGGSLADMAALGANPTADVAELKKYRDRQKQKAPEPKQIEQPKALPVPPVQLTVQEAALA